MIRFHLDEPIDSGIAQGFRRRGIDVTTTVEAGLAAASDEEHIDFARSQGRVIVTQDRDFLRLAAAGVEHAGIAYSEHGLRSIGELLRELALIHQILTADDMLNHVEFVYSKQKLEAFHRHNGTRPYQIW